MDSTLLDAAPLTDGAPEALLEIDADPDTLVDGRADISLLEEPLTGGAPETPLEGAVPGALPIDAEAPLRGGATVLDIADWETPLKIDSVPDTPVDDAPETSLLEKVPLAESAVLKDCDPEPTLDIDGVPDALPTDDTNAPLLETLALNEGAAVLETADCDTSLEIDAVPDETDTSLLEKTPLTDSATPPDVEADGLRLTDAVSAAESVDADPEMIVLDNSLLLLAGINDEGGALIPLNDAVPTEAVIESVTPEDDDPDTVPLAELVLSDWLA